MEGNLAKILYIDYFSRKNPKFNISETNVKSIWGIMIKPWKMACFQGFLTIWNF